MDAATIKKARMAKKMTQSDLAYALGVSLPTVSRWETGRCTPSPMATVRLCKVLGLKEKGDRYVAMGR